MSSLAKLSREYRFTHPAGGEIFLFRLQNDRGTEVVITNYGAIIASFKVQRPGKISNDIVLGFDDPKDYLSDNYLRNYCWMGCAVGRYANRIKDGQLTIDGTRYALTKNMESCQLHGGYEGFDKKVWEPVNEGSLPVPFVVLRYRSADQEEGFPGNLDAEVRFELSQEDELSYAYTAVTDQPTAINLTHHGYFNLNNGTGTIKNHLLTIYSDSLLGQDENLVTNGMLLPVEGTAFDFREARPVKNACDKSFVITGKADSKGLLLAAEAESLQSAIKLQVYTTDPVVHFYAGAGMQPVTGKNNTVYGPFSGFCLETHKHPNAINIPHFPNTVLRPGETYYQKTVYKVIA